MYNDYINELECRILNLEYERVKKLAAPIRRKLQSAPARSAPSSLWELRTTNEHGQRRYSRRAGTGTWASLPENRSLWPADMRQAVESLEAFDKKRSRNGHLISECNEPVRLVE